MKLVFSRIVLVLTYRSGLSDNKGLLWWHPAVWVFFLLAVVSTIIGTTGIMVKEIVRVIQSENWRSKL